MNPQQIQRRPLVAIPPITCIPNHEHMARCVEAIRHRWAGEVRKKERSQ